MLPLLTRRKRKYRLDQSAISAPASSKELLCKDDAEPRRADDSAFPPGVVELPPGDA